MNKEAEVERRLELEWNRRMLRDMIKADIKCLKQRLRRLPSKSELLDHLFSKDREDPEAKDLERRLDRVLEKYCQ